MFRNHTTLRKLQKILSKKEYGIFDNQVSFYNGLFGITNPEHFSNDLVSYMESAHNGDAKKDRKKQLEIESYLKSGLDNSSSNVGKHINDEPGMSIPRHHCLHWAYTEYKKEICRRIVAIIRYSTYRRECCGKATMDMKALFSELKSELFHASNILSQADTSDDLLMAAILYEIVQTHLSERHSGDIDQEDNLSFGKVNMNQQIEEYYLTCDCYEVTSIDFFIALKRMSGKNVIAASNLAGFYYVGREFLVKNENGGPHGKYVVERNYEKAAYYFKYAASSEPPYAPALYSYGYMLLHNETGDKTKEERLSEVEQYYRRAADHKFHHAVSGLGDLALLRANQLLKNTERKEHFGEIIKELSIAIGRFHQAKSMGSFWGSIKAAQFLDNPDYTPYLADVLRAANLPITTNARDEWKCAVDMGNVFAMDELAMLDLRLGYQQEARELFEQAAMMNYPNASYHMACCFYAPDGLTPDADSYGKALTKASSDGSARASLLLGKLSLQKSGIYDTETMAWFLKAEEQNLQCFEKEVYDELHRFI